MQGIASDLLRLVERRARELSCRAIYLHVLAVYNASAVAFYRRHEFWEASLLNGFYNIRCTLCSRPALKSLHASSAGHRQQRSRARQ